MDIKKYTHPLLINKPLLAMAGVYSIVLSSSLALLSHYHVISLECGVLSSTSSIFLISTAAGVGALLFCSIIAKKMYNEGNLDEEDKVANRSSDFLASAFVSGAVVSTILAALSSTGMVDISFGHALSTEVSSLIFAVGASITLGAAYTIASSYDDEYNNLRKGVVVGVSAFGITFLATSTLVAQDLSFSVLNHLASSALISIAFGIVLGGVAALVFSMRESIEESIEESITYITEDSITLFPDEDSNLNNYHYDTPPGISNF